MPGSPTTSIFSSNDESYDPSSHSIHGDFDFGFSDSSPSDEEDDDTQSGVGPSEHIYSSPTGSVSSSVATTGATNTHASQPVIQNLPYRHAQSASISSPEDETWAMPSEAELVDPASDSRTISRSNSRADATVPSSAGGADSPAKST